MHDCTLSVVVKRLALSEVVWVFGIQGNICSGAWHLRLFRAKITARESCQAFCRETCLPVGSSWNPRRISGWSIRGTTTCSWMCPLLLTRRTSMLLFRSNSSIRRSSCQPVELILLEESNYSPEVKHSITGIKSGSDLCLSRSSMIDLSFWRHTAFVGILDKASATRLADPPRWTIS